MTSRTVTIWIVLNEAGDYEVAADEDAAVDRWNDEFLEEDVMGPPWERGLNENTNGLIRDFFPKGTDFSTISSAEVAKVERLLNARPRKSLGFRSPQEVFHSLAYS